MTLETKLEQLRDWMDECQAGEFEEETTFPPPVALEKVVAFEQTYGIALPEELRAIITQLSDGLGLWLSLEQWANPPEVMGQWLQRENLHLPFVPGDLFDCDSVRHDPEDEDEASYDRRVAAKERELQNCFEKLLTTLVKGTLWLAGDLEEGTGYFIVVTGDTPGTLWKINTDVNRDASATVRVRCVGSIFDAIEDMDNEL